ncbi:MAG TPA: hypothetical protein VGV59_14185 [Pyrinomonadaceae bacterium]|nr:hypothetical protein [Pyrinomonadaceae bacterium]
MLRKARLLICALLLSGVQLVPAALVGAQQPAGARPKGKKTTAAADAPAADIDPMEEVRRTTAITLLTTLADDARNFREQPLRARVQARAADTLWDTDKERARALFRRAWDAAEAADTESAARAAEEQRRAGGSGRSAAFVSRPNLRREVLRLAARHDRALGEEFLARLDEARKAETSATSQVNANAAAATPGGEQQAKRPDPGNPPVSIQQRLRLALQLLEDGDKERALQFADPALTSVNTYSINFLDTLRTRDAAAADQRIAALMARAANDLASDANTVSLLSAYFYTPFLYHVFQPGGGANTMRWRGEDVPPPSVSPELRAAFFNTGAQILLRPIPSAEADRTSSGRAGTYLVIARLLPLFEQNAPDKAALLRAKMAALTPDTPERARSTENGALTRGLVPEDPSRDRVQENLDRLDRAKDAAERDEIYFNAAQSAMSRDEHDRARSLADKIEDLDLRRQVRGLIDFEATSKAIREKRPEDVLRVARTGELTNLQRTWALTEAAGLLSKDEPGRAGELLDEALVEAKRIDQASPERVRALVAIVTHMASLDKTRVWEVMQEVVKASNGVTEFTGEDGGLVSRAGTKNQMTTMNFSVESFDLTNIFSALARENLDRAVELAKTFTGESPRAIATLAVARAVLDKKKAESAAMR